MEWYYCNVYFRLFCVLYYCSSSDEMRYNQSNILLIASAYYKWKFVNNVFLCDLTGLIKTRFKSVSRFFFFFFFFTNFFFTNFFFLPYFILIFLIPPLFLYSSLFCPIFSPFSYSKGGNFVRCHFFPANPLLSFLLKGGVVKGENKKPIFFFVLTITPGDI